MNSLFTTPNPTERPIRILVYGYSKVGKSHFVSSATEVGPLYWIDTERGSDFYPPEEGHGFQVNYSKDPRVALEAIKMAHEEAIQGGPRPIVALDSFSSVWFEQQEVAEKLTEEWGKGKGRSTFRAWGPAKKPLKRLYEICQIALCHIIITARAKEEYEVTGKGEPKKVGDKPDIERNLPYAMDFIAMLSVNTAREAKPKPKDFKARVVGTRTSPESEHSIPIGTIYSDPKFSDFLVAQMEGETPVEVATGVERQVVLALEAPGSWSEMLDRTTKLGWKKEDITAALNEKFGTFDRDMLDEYWEYMKEKDASLPATDG